MCKAVRYTVSSAPIAARVCWCRLCQYLGAGGATVNAAFASADITIAGETRDYPSTADSGNAMHRRFCPNCGTPLSSTAESRPHLIFVRAGTLDDPEIVKPGGTIWISSAPSWACFDEALPKFDKQSPPVA